MPIDIDQIALQIAERVREKGTQQGRIPFLTGDLRKSITVELVGPGEATVGSNLSYARAVHDGRKALDIKPKNKKALFWPGAKHPVRGVHQKARLGRPFLQEAVEEMQAEGYDFLTEGILKDVEEEFTKDLLKNIVIQI
jgi:phage gpG-like protein